MLSYFSHPMLDADSSVFTGAINVVRPRNMGGEITWRVITNSCLSDVESAHFVGTEEGSNSDIDLRCDFLTRVPCANTELWAGRIIKEYLHTKRDERGGSGSRASRPIFHCPPEDAGNVPA